MNKTVIYKEFKTAFLMMLLPILFQSQVVSAESIVADNVSGSHWDRWGIFLLIGIILLILVWYFFSSNDERLTEEEAFMAEHEEIWNSKEIIRRYPKIYSDGIHKGEALGHNGLIKVSVVVRGGHLRDIEVVEHTEKTSLAPRVFSKLGRLMIEQNNAHVDPLSGAFETSVGFIDAVYDALADNFKDGTYTGEGEGYRGPVEVSVKIEDGQITDIQVLDYKDYEKTSPAIYKELTTVIVEQNRIDVDVVSGATESSQGFIDAVTNAIRKS